MPQKFLSIKNLEKYQTNRKNAPPWFKIHRLMFGDPEFVKLSTAYRFLYIGLIHLAVESGNKIYNDDTFILQRLYIPSTDGILKTYRGHTKLDLTPLYRAGFLHTTNLSRVLSEREREGETEREEIPKPQTREVGKCGFPQEWKPPQEEMDQWKTHGILNPWVEFATFRDHALANDRRCKDWPAAWRNWCRKAIRMKEERANGVHAMRV